MALVAEGRFDEAYRVASEPNPFPSVCGRICTHPCESACARAELDQPLAIAALKRFVADRVGPETTPVSAPVIHSEKVAIVGAGPAGLTCARDLAKLGYQTTVFEALPVAGGMLKTGIPDYRLPKDVLGREIEQVTALGVELELGKRAGSDFTVDGLMADGYSAVFLAVGLQKSSELEIPGAGLEGVERAVEFLRRLNLGEQVSVGDRVVVIGGGDVALDAARSAIRLQKSSGREPRVTLAYRRTREEMPALAEEVEQAIDEGIEIEFLVAPLEVTGKDGRVSAIKLQRCELGEPDASGRRRPVPIEGDITSIEADTVVFAIGQEIVCDFLEGCEGVSVEKGQIRIDRDDADDRQDGRVRRRRRRRHRWLDGDRGDRGRQPRGALDSQLPARRDAAPGLGARDDRSPPDRRGAGPARGRPAYPDHGARRGRAARILGRGRGRLQRATTRSPRLAAAWPARSARSAGPASRPARPARSISTSRRRSRSWPSARSSSPRGTRSSTPGARSPLGFGRFANVLTQSQLARLLSPSGPTAGELERPSDGAVPKKIFMLQCVGSRDCTASGNEHCSAICCLFATLHASLIKQHYPDADVTIGYTDLRAPGKAHEEYYRLVQERGVRYVRSRVGEVIEEPDKSLRVRFEDTVTGRKNEELFDLVVLSAGLEASDGTAEIAHVAGLQQGAAGFIKEYHPKLRPVDTQRAGIFVAGTAQGPKNIPDTIAQAKAAAARVISMLSSRLRADAGRR